MRIDPAGWPFIGGAAALGALAAGLGATIPAAALAVLAVLCLAFFRDPDRRAPAVAQADGVPDPRVVLSPADGRVLVAGPADSDLAPPGEWLQVSIFLSLFDVHVNRVPVSGRVTRIAYRPGRFLAAFRAEAATANERSEIWVETATGAVVFRQVVGVLARRVVCRLQTGQAVRAGDRCGVMKFGSRMDVFVPRGATLSVGVGDRVWGGVSVLARL